MQKGDTHRPVTSQEQQADEINTTRRRTPEVRILGERQEIKVS